MISRNLGPSLHLAVKTQSEGGESMARLSLAPTAQAALSAAPASMKHASTRPAHAWPTKRAFYANHFYTGYEALELNI